MKSIGGIVMAFIVSLLLAMGVSNYEFFHAPTFTYRYKLTIQAVVDGHVVSASNVSEVSQMMDIDKSVHAGMRGEALYLDLGPGHRPLIASLSPRPKSETATSKSCWGQNGPTCLTDLYAIPKLEWDLDSKKLNGFDELLRQRGPRDISPEQLSLLVTFADVNEPKTVLEVDPANPNQALGGGFAWKRITLEITDEAVTTGLENKLGWLINWPGGMLDGNRVTKNTTLANNLSPFDFRRPVK